MFDHKLWVVFNVSSKKVIESVHFYDAAVGFRDMYVAKNDARILEINLSKLIPLLFNGGFFKESNNG